jgi:putative transposase
MASHEFSVPVLCDVIGLARSSFYYKSQRVDDSELRSNIEGVCLRYTRYGYRRVLGRLQRKGYRVGHNRVNSLMGEMDLSVRPRRRRIRTTKSDGSHPKYPNLLKGLEVIRPDQVWCADITYSAPCKRRLGVLARVN